MDRMDSFLVFSRIFHPKWMKIICHATGAKHIHWDLFSETIIGVKAPISGVWVWVIALHPGSADNIPDTHI